MGCSLPGGGGFGAFRIQLYPSPTAMAKEGIAAGGAMDVHTALQDVLKTALIHCGLAHEVHTAATALGKHQAHLCVRASSRDVKLQEGRRRRGSRVSQLVIASPVAIRRGEGAQRKRCRGSPFPEAIFPTQGLNPCLLH